MDYRLQWEKGWNGLPAGDLPVDWLVEIPLFSFLTQSLFAIILNSSPSLMKKKESFPVNNDDRR